MGNHGFLLNMPPRYRELMTPLLLGLAVTVLAFLFATLGSEMSEGETHGFDTYLLSKAQSLRATHPGVAEVMRDWSGLGSASVLGVITLMTVGYLLLVSMRTTALLVASATLSGVVLVSALKAGFGRLRPEPVFAAITVPGLSFPSGHASMSAMIFLTIGALLAATRARWNERAYLLTGAMALTTLVGISRIVLGVHWATDVLAGWMFGTAWAIAWLLLDRKITSRSSNPFSNK